MALSEGLHAHLPKKDIEKKVNLTEQTQDEKKIVPILFLFLYYEKLYAHCF